jgi:hypothetical protein
MDNLELLSRMRQIQAELSMKCGQRRDVLDQELMALSLEFDRLESQYNQMLYPKRVFKEAI